MKPEISVIIPTLNEEKCIGKTLKQFLPVKDRYNLELIVSDGKSKDNTIKIAKKYADKVIVHAKKRKQNIAEGRNAGAKVAKGDILVFLDADTRVGNLKDFFEKIIDKFKDESIVAATTKVLVYPEEERFVDRLFHNIYSKGVSFLISIGKGASRGECQIIRAKQFRKIKGYNEKLIASEDMELFMRLAKVGKIHFLNDLNVYESPRRYREKGYIKVITKWFLNGFWVIFAKKSYSKIWEQVR